MKRKGLYLFWLASLSVVVASCASEAPHTEKVSSSPSAASALSSITSDGLLNHTKVLASDEYEGRAPGTKGEELTVKYLTEQFKKLGLKPGNPDGTYVQKVPLAGFTPQPTLPLLRAAKPVNLELLDRLHCAFSALRARSEGRKLRYRFCRIWRCRAGIRLGRLQRCRCERQDHCHAHQRSGRT